MILVSAPTGWGDSREYIAKRGRENCIHISVEARKWYADYIRTYIVRDVRQIKNITDLIVTEFIKQRFNRGFSHNLFFWRDNVGHEVDIIENQQ